MSILDNINFDKILEIEKDEIWKRKIIGKSDVDISRLIQKLNINDWVNEGRSYIQSNSDVCPFCQQKTITSDFKIQLEEYFDEDYTNALAKVKSFEGEYLDSTQILLNTLNQILQKESEITNSKLDVIQFNSFLQALEKNFVLNRSLISNKNKESSRSIELITSERLLNNLLNLILRANSEVIKHNEIVLNFSNEKKHLISSIWKYIINDHKEWIDSFVKRENSLNVAINGLKEKIAKQNKFIAEKDAEIKQASKNVTSVQTSIDEINKILKFYGFINFEIVKAVENKYRIQREDGTSVNKTLSEGEITFITFLYFMQLAKGGTTTENVVDERILVIDDPVSSLDSNVLFVVSSLLKELMLEIKKNKGYIKQLILLTHNVYFHKEVSFIDGRTKMCNQTHFWILRKKNNITTIQKYETENPIHSSYELLWKELKESEKNSGITVQNIMRRIIENYFKILGKYGDDSIIKQFEDPQEQKICRSLICWINDGSHCMPDDLFVEYPVDIIDKYYDVFKKIFIKMKHGAHYNMMMNEKDQIDDVVEESENNE